MPGMPPGTDLPGRIVTHALAVRRKATIGHPTGGKKGGGGADNRTVTRQLPPPGLTRLYKVAPRPSCATSK